MNEQRSWCKIPVVCFRLGPSRVFKGRGAGEQERVGESKTIIRRAQGGWRSKLQFFRLETIVEALPTCL